MYCNLTAMFLHVNYNRAGKRYMSIFAYIIAESIKFFFPSAIILANCNFSLCEGHNLREFVRHNNAIYATRSGNSLTSLTSRWIFFTSM